MHFLALLIRRFTRALICPLAHGLNRVEARWFDGRGREACRGDRWPRVIVAVPAGGGLSDLEHPTFWWVNTLLDDVENALHCAYHALRPEYLQLYLSESRYRFDLATLALRLIVAAARTLPLSYRLATLDA